MTVELNKVITAALDDLKAQDIVTLDVKGLSDVTDALVIASGTSSRHVKSLADNVIAEAKKQNLRPLGMEGIEAGDWALVDFGEIVVHVMLPQSRKFYDLEKLWTPLAASDSGQNTDTTL